MSSSFSVRISLTILTLALGSVIASPSLAAGCASGNNLDNTILCSGNDTPTSIDGMGGNDSITFSDNASVHNVHGGTGDDSLAFHGSSGFGFVNAEDGNDRLTVDGSAGGSYFNGDSGNNTRYGYDGSDSLSGSDGNDFLIGHGATDSLSGDDINDSLVGGAGADTLDGGVGIDLAYYGTSAAGVNVSLLSHGGIGGDAQGDSLIGIENLAGSNLADTLVGDGGNNMLCGYDGSDSLAGSGGKHRRRHSSSKRPGAAGVQKNR